MNTWNNSNIGKVFVIEKKTWYITVSKKTNTTPQKKTNKQAKKQKTKQNKKQNKTKQKNKNKTKNSWETTIRKMYMWT